MSEENKNTILSSKEALDAKLVEADKIRSEVNRLTRDYYNNEIVGKIAHKYVGKCYRTDNDEYVLILQPPKLLEGRVNVSISDNWKVLKINSFKDDTPYGCSTDVETEVTPYYEDEISLYFLLEYPKDGYFTEITREEFDKHLEDAVEISKGLIRDRIENILPRRYYRF